VLVGDDRQRALIECKFYARAIDLPIVRNFFAVIEDVGCDLAAIVTTVGFSSNAQAYAAAKGIDLLLLRDTRDEDLEGGITSIQLHLPMFAVNLSDCRVAMPPDASHAEGQLTIALDDADVVIEHASGRRVPFAERFQEHHASFGFDHDDGAYPVADVFQGPTWLVAAEQRIPVSRIDWTFLVSRGTTTSVVEHEPLVSLVSYDGEVLEVMSEQQLHRVRFDREHLDEET